MRICAQLEESEAFHIASVSVDALREKCGRFSNMDGLASHRALELFLQNKIPALSPERIATLLTMHDGLVGEG